MGAFGQLLNQLERLSALIILQKVSCSGVLSQRMPISSINTLRPCSLSRSADTAPP